DDDSGLAVYRLTYDREDGTQDIVDIGIENGLQIDESSGTIKLGGKLTEKTTIETDADNTLAIDGLEAGGTEEGRILMLDANNVVKTVSSNKFVRFFYMPSVIFDTSIFNPTGPRYERNLYDEYIEQFRGTGTPTMVKNPAAPDDIPYLPEATDLHYYITYYDDKVFDDLTIDDNGLLHYRVIGQGTPTSFMNIVFVIKGEE